MSEGPLAGGRTAQIRLHKNLYPSAAVETALEAALSEGHEVTWHRAGSSSHHTIEVTGPHPERVADEIAQLALEQTVSSTAHH